MFKIKILVIVLSAFLLLCMFSCIDKEAFNVDTSFVYHPEFSIPIGMSEIPMEDYIKELTGLVTIPDSLISDTSTFLYEDEEYKIPDTITNQVVEQFSLFMIQDEVENIKSLMFRTNLSNEIPANLSVQVYFTNHIYEPIDSLYENGPLVIDAAAIDNVGNVVKKETLQNDVYFSESKIANIVSAQYLIIETKVYISNSKDILSKYYSNQKLVVQLAARVGIEIDTNEDM